MIKCCKQIRRDDTVEDCGIEATFFYEKTVESNIGVPCFARCNKHHFDILVLNGQFNIWRSVDRDTYLILQVMCK